MAISKNANWVVIANGELLPLECLKKFLKDCCVMALDGAAMHCLKNNIKPDIVLGDFDSIDQSALQCLRNQNSTRLIFAPDQQKTDLEKGLRVLAEYEPKSVYVCQATGLRLDHSINNLRLLRRTHELLPQTTLITKTEKVRFIKDRSFILSAPQLEPVALVSYPEAYVTSKGLEYDMKNLQLKFAERESTSNFLKETIASVTVKGEILLIFSHSTDLKLT